MSSLDFDMVGREPVAGGFVSSWSPPFVEEVIAGPFLQFCKNVLQKGKSQ